MWHAVVQLVEALCYKSEVRGFDLVFQLLNPTGRSMALGSTRPLNRNKYHGHLLGVKAADT